MDSEGPLTREEAFDLVDRYIGSEGSVSSTQEILDSGAVSRLKGYQVRPGKVSDCIFGSNGKYEDKLTGKQVEFENPPLNTEDGRSIRGMVRTARISTHDIVRGDIPFKDQILALNHNYMRRMVQGVLGTSQFDVPGLEDSAVVIAAEDLTQVPFENVLRAYMAKSSTETSLYQHFIKGKREFCGHKLPDNLIPNGVLPYVMDTPSTKSDEHDESVSAETLARRGLVSRNQYREIINGSLVGFGIVTQFARGKGLIFVDTKTEHGINRDGKIVAQDELYTMDSSRFWLLNDYNNQLDLLSSGEIDELKPVSYSKEFARGFSKGEEGYSDDQRRQIAVRYIEGIQHLTGKRFVPDMRPRDERVIDGLQKIVGLAV